MKNSKNKETETHWDIKVCDTQLSSVALRPLLFLLTPYILNPQISGNMDSLKRT